MHRRTYIFALAAVIALAALGVLAGRAASAAAPLGSCPTIGDPNAFRLVPIGDPTLIGDPNVRIAQPDRNGDGFLCLARTRLFTRTLNLIADDAIGDPTVFPPDPCSDPWVSIGFEDPNEFPWIRQIDLNQDRVVCGFAGSYLSERTIVTDVMVVDNPNAVLR